MRFSLLMLLVIFALSSCTSKTEFSENFDNIHNRTWIDKNFWSIPLEDWKVENGKLLCIGNESNSRVNLLTRVLSPGKGNFKISVKVGLENGGNIPGSAGLLIGIQDPEDPDVRAACYFGKETAYAGVSKNGFAFLNGEREQLPDSFDFNEFKITIDGDDNHLKMKVIDKNGIGSNSLSCSVESISGLIAVANNMVLREGTEKPGNSTFSYDDLKLSGTKVVEKSENAFGPILWTMYTLSKNNLKLMALLPPIGEADNKDVSLQLKDNNNWQTIATQSIEPDSRTAIFKVENWDATRTVNYRVEYIDKKKDLSEIPEYYEGVIQKDPIDKPLVLGALTCQHSSGYPYTPLVKSLSEVNPDLLYFSGDQIYEANGGYPIKREPEEVSIINYLGKYYMFGWAFGDLMRNKPTICTPDDHDVYHGNLWGESGEPMDKAATTTGSFRGFIQSVKMVNAVNRTQCGQLPDPYDPTPIKQGMSVWYTNLTYGRISFAIISDRVFKTGPEKVSIWEGRNDHLKGPLKDMSILDNKGFEMLGDRQMKFLNDWIMDWNEADMKVLLSQTVYANVATHHGTGALEGGGDGVLLGDLDSGGWPKSARDGILKLIRKASTFHINGDQHIPTLVQYGIDNFRDAGWSFCTPAISTGYQRWFLPDVLEFPVINRPEHNNSNTGNYLDGFGNKNYVYAVGNPSTASFVNENRYTTALLKASGFGVIVFDQKDRTIEMDSWRFNADIKNPNLVRDQFPGWPFKISQFDNLGLGAENVLPLIKVNKPNQLIQIRNERSNEVASIYRMKGMEIQPKLFESGVFTVIIGEGNNIEKLIGLVTQKNKNEETVSVEL